MYAVVRFREAEQITRKAAPSSSHMCKSEVMTVNGVQTQGQRQVNKSSKEKPKKVLKVSFTPSEDVRE
jgi:hypothetical protein